jgi:hypothetical protein
VACARRFIESFAITDVAIKPEITATAARSFIFVMWDSPSLL